MSYTKHHAIIVTSWKLDGLWRAHAKAWEIFPEDMVGAIVQSPLNIFQSFFIAPDGSSEHFKTSVDYDIKRTEFLTWLDSQRYGDGSTWLAWAELSYSSDDKNAAITNHAWAKK